MKTSHIFAICHPVSLPKGHLLCCPRPSPPPHSSPAARCATPWPRLHGSPRGGRSATCPRGPEPPGAWEGDGNGEVNWFYRILIDFHEQKIVLRVNIKPYLNLKSINRLHSSWIIPSNAGTPGTTCRVRSEGKQKGCRPTALKMGPRRGASQRNVAKGAGMPVLFCSKHARLNFNCHKQCKDMCTASGVYRTLGATPCTPRHQSWLTSALCKAATPGKAARLAFVSGNVDSWGAGPCLRAHVRIHHAEATLN